MVPWKKSGVLQIHAEIASQGFSRRVCCCDAVDCDSAASDLVKTHQQMDERGFSRARCADNGNFLSLFRSKTDIFQALTFAPSAKNEIFL